MKTILHVKNHILTNLSRFDFLHVESHGWKGIIVFIYLFVFYQNTYFPLNIAVNLIFFKKICNLLGLFSIFISYKVSLD